MGIFKKGNKSKELERNNGVRVASEIVIYTSNDQKLIFGIETETKIRHRDGKITELVKARMKENYINGVTNDFSNAKYICFEIPEGRKDLINVLLQAGLENGNYEIPQNEYKYLGKIAQDGSYDITNSPSTSIMSHIAEMTNAQQENLRQQRERREQIAQEKNSFREKLRINDENTKEIGAKRLETEEKNYESGYNWRLRPTGRVL